MVFKWYEKEVTPVLLKVICSSRDEAAFIFPTDVKLF